MVPFVGMDNYLVDTLRGFLWDIFLTVITPLGWYLTNLWQVVRQELPEQLLSVQPSHPSTTTLSERMEVDPTPEVSSELDFSEVDLPPKEGAVSEDITLRKTASKRV